jgi:hypothetical protein
MINKELYETKNGELVWSSIDAIDVECAIRAVDIAGQKGVKSWRKKTMVYLPTKTKLSIWQKIWDIAKGFSMN